MNLPASIEAQLSSVPPLPKTVQLYMDCARQRVPAAPDDMHITGYLWIVSTFIARRVKVQTRWDTIYPNLWALWLAETGVNHKSTALKLPLYVVEKHTPHLLLPSDTTPERLQARLSGEPPKNYDKLLKHETDIWNKRALFAAQQSFFRDEFTGFLRDAGKQYNSGILNLLQATHDCRARYTRETKGDGVLTIVNAYMPLLSGTTPGGISPFLLNLQAWADGWWPRFILVGPGEYEEDLPPANVAALNPRVEKALLNILDTLHEQKANPIEELGKAAEWSESTSPDDAHAVECTLAPETDALTVTLELWLRSQAHEQRDDPYMPGVLSRTLTRLVKVATLLTIVEEAERGLLSPELVILPETFLLALSLVAGWIDNLPTLLGQSERQGATTLALSARCLNAVTQDTTGFGLSASTVSSRFRGVELWLTQKSLASLAEEGELVDIFVKKKRGKKTLRYVLPGRLDEATRLAQADPDTSIELAEPKETP